MWLALTPYPRLRLLAELHREFRKPLHVAYIDIKAAFDSVDRQALWKALHVTEAPQFLIQKDTPNTHFVTETEPPGRY